MHEADCQRERSRTGEDIIHVRIELLCRRIPGYDLPAKLQVKDSTACEKTQLLVDMRRCHVHAIAIVIAYLQIVPAWSP